MVWYGMVWYGMVWYGMVWYGMVWYGMVWYGMVWYGMVWYGMVLLNLEDGLELDDELLVGGGELLAPQRHQQVNRLTRDMTPRKRICHRMGWDGMGWDGMGWDGMGWDGMGWDGMGYSRAHVVFCIEVLAILLRVLGGGLDLHRHLVALLRLLLLLVVLLNACHHSNI